MPSTLQSLEIDKMSVSERIRLVQEILDSIAEDVEREPLTEAQRQEVDRRLAAHRANPDLAVPLDRVEADALARVQR